ncbi:MAG TPA: hypothetical protein VMR62_31030 [Bryobacteraceae bacterium]|nr:hypothetical protein [Bryobacteraceae bacterium]
MTPFDPILHDHEKRIKLLEASRRDLEEQMIVMAAIERKHGATMEAWEEFLAEQIQREIEQKKRDEEWKAKHEDWKAHHELAMKEFDDKLNGLIAWLDDFVKRNPRNGK